MSVRFCVAQLWRQLAVTLGAALARYQAFGTTCLVRRLQPLDLANGQPQLLGSNTLCDAALRNAPHQRESL